MGSSPPPTPPPACSRERVGLGEGAGAEGLAVAEDLDTPASETIVRVARERGAPAIVVGGHDQGRPDQCVTSQTR